MDCIFCKIINKDIPAEIIFEDEELLVFKDIYPQAPVHILTIPKKHISTINDAKDSDLSILGKMMLKAKDIAKELKIDEDGYRLVMNCNENGGQTVFHIHLHLLGGKKLGGSMVG